MIIGYFDERGRPYVEGQVRVPRLNIGGWVDFLVDTGATATSLSPNDGDNLLVPTSELVSPVLHRGIAGTRTYYREPAVILFPDGAEWRRFDVDLYLAPPDEGADYLPSLRGRDVLNAVRMEYDFQAGRLELEATAAL
jgi:hypothetical protein